MLENVLQTNLAESSRMMTLPYIAWIVGFGVVPALLYLWVKVDYRVWYKEIGYRIGLIGAFSSGNCWYCKSFLSGLRRIVRNNKSVPALIVPSNFISAGINEINAFVKRICRTHN